MDQGRHPGPGAESIGKRQIGYRGVSHVDLNRLLSAERLVDPNTVIRNPYSVSDQTQERDFTCCIKVPRYHSVGVEYRHRRGSGRLGTLCRTLTKKTLRRRRRIDRRKLKRSARIVRVAVHAYLYPQNSDPYLKCIPARASGRSRQFGVEPVAERSFTLDRPSAPKSERPCGKAPMSIASVFSESVFSPNDAQRSP
jgi:hypothetical protein